MRDVEILIRYYAFKFYLTTYSGSLQAFLDFTCSKLNEDWNNQCEDISSELSEMKLAICATRDIFGPENAFKKYKNSKYEDKYNRAVIDIMLYYLSQKDYRDVALKKSSEVKAAFENCCMSNAQFLASLETTTKSVSSVKCRFDTWGHVLNTTLGTNFDTPIWPE